MKPHSFIYLRIRDEPQPIDKWMPLIGMRQQFAQTSTNRAASWSLAVRPQCSGALIKLVASECSRRKEPLSRHDTMEIFFLFRIFILCIRVRL
jgi:hypothetical protein